MKRLMLNTLTCLLALAVPAFAYVGDAYVTPDSWSKHVNANGIKAKNRVNNKSHNEIWRR